MFSLYDLLCFVVHTCFLVNVLLHHNLILILKVFVIYKPLTFFIWLTKPNRMYLDKTFFAQNDPRNKLLNFVIGLGQPV